MSHVFSKENPPKLIHYTIYRYHLQKKLCYNAFGDTMFEWIKHFYKKDNNNSTEEKALEPVIITIHGYGRRRKHEFDNFASWGKQDGFEIIQFDMYDYLMKMTITGSRGYHVPKRS